MASPAAVSAPASPPSDDATTDTTPPDTGALNADDVEQLLERANDDTQTIYLWRDSKGHWAYVEQLAPLTTRELGIRETVRQRHGGGHYRARLKGPAGKWGISRQFLIEGQPKGAAAAIVETIKESGAEMPSWLEKIVLPVVTTLGTMIAKRITEPPQVDPLVLKLLELQLHGGGHGEGVDPIELNRLLQDAEARGEKKGREFGELFVRATQGRSSGGGTLAAVREMAPIVTRMLDTAKEQRAAAAGAPASLPSTPPAPPPMPRSSAPADITPAWLRPFVQYKPQLLSMADMGMDPSSASSMVIEQSDDDTWEAIVAAEEAGTLETDLLSAFPELQGSDKRRAFAAQLLKDVREAIYAAPEEESPTTDASDELEETGTDA